MTGIVFVDANVFVYASDSRDHAKQSLAITWIERLWRQGCGRTSLQVVSEYYFNLKRKLHVPEDLAWEAALKLMAWEPLATDQTLLMRARELERRYRLNWWDCLHLAAAERQGCETILTEDLQDGQEYGLVTARSPFTLETGEPRAAYSFGATLDPDAAWKQEIGRRLKEIESGTAQLIDRAEFRRRMNERLASG